MSSLLRSMRAHLGGRDLAIKNSLVAKLSSCVKDLQVEHADPDRNDENMKEVISALCTVLEAIFIHGLKESFIQKVSQAMMSEFDARPDPNFWGPLLEVSHRDVIDQVLKLNLIQTDVGRCRAWLRLALNEGILSRYLEAMRREGQRSLSHYYGKGALLRDVDVLDVVQRLLEGIESYPLDLPLNSSLLNTWTLQPLLQAGLWTPPIRTSGANDSVAVATDIAQVLDRETQEALPADNASIASFSSHHIVTPMAQFNEEEALKLILGTPVDETPISAKLRAEETASENKENAVNNVKAEGDEHQVTPDESKSVETVQQAPKGKDDDDNCSALGNSIIGRLGWSSSFEESMSDSGSNLREVEQTEKKRKEPSRRSSKALQSYHSLLENYNSASSPGVKLPDLNDFLQQFESSNTDSSGGSISETADLSYPQDLGFEIVGSSFSSDHVPEFGSLLLQVTKLPREYGLDAQKYTCYGCDQPIGFNFGAAMLCGLTGRYFCENCTVNTGEEWIVPARVLLNWDYRRYRMSKRAATFLSEIQHHPLLDLKTLNPCLYLTVEEVSQLQKLRNELNLLRAYLFTCREPIIEELQKMVWPREYLYEHVHLYSISDLIQIPNGALAQQLRQINTFARKHVLSCWLCSQKGFFCEICENPNIIYPFDTETTYRCPGCSSVFHSECLNADRPCPKCKRRKQRESSTRTDSNLLEV